MWDFEQDLFGKGIKIIAGVDEAGRGPLAGPVVAAAVIIPPGYVFKEKITDSKKISARLRQKAFEEITLNCSYAYSIVSEEAIDKDNILNAALKAMANALSKLIPQPEWILVDGPHKPPVTFPCTAIINGDSKSISVASASIIAKVIRDEIMLKFDEEYPQYGFAKHKGYGTKAHRQAIEKFGPCPIHRKSFQPIKKLLKSLN